MSTAPPPKVAPLIAGQRLDRAEFHERYKATPPGFRAELIGGVVVMPSPVSDLHGDRSFLVIAWLGHYGIRTPGVRGSENVSVALHDLAEVQPDALLRIQPDWGGQTRSVDQIIHGGPELVVEVSRSSRWIDLGAKLADYERAGTLEYVVLGIEPDEVYWHVRKEGKLVRVAPDPDGLYRSEAFPGLWLDPAALLAEDGPGLIAAVDRGLATAEHADFVARLAATRRPGG